MIIIPGRIVDYEISSPRPDSNADDVNLVSSAVEDTLHERLCLRLSHFIVPLHHLDPLAVRVIVHHPADFVRMEGEEFCTPVPEPAGEFHRLSVNLRYLSASRSSV